MMFRSSQWTNEGHPDGGVTQGRGFVISWQRGALVDAAGDRIEPNGAFVEDVIAAVMNRIEHYQETKFKCGDNDDALSHLAAAQDALRRRRSAREVRGIEGTHEV